MKKFLESLVGPANFSRLVFVQADHASSFLRTGDSLPISRAIPAILETRVALSFARTPSER